ncbi:MAG: tetratricopeptide repeat protein [Deltaproteobacteria bacterium]|nr:tetratricopeptide repeat protein [Deltaproteobacteria bacterium]
MRKYIFAIIITLLLFLPLHASAQIKEIIAEGTYNMGDGETPTVAESRALLQAKRTALEQAGTYVESYTKVENMQVTKDEIQVLASGIMEVEILDKKRTVVGDGFRFWVKIKARVNPDKIAEMAKRVKEKSVIEDYKKIQQAYDKSQKDIEELKKQLAGAKGEKEKKQAAAKITDEERLFQTNAWFEKGYQHWLNKEYDSAIEAYTKAIALNPNLAQAYSNRGVAYAYKGQYDRAIEDYNKAIALDPNFKGQHDRAIEDLNKAIALDPNVAGAYNNRGLAYALSGNMGRAIEDYNKAIALDPSDTFAYQSRGDAYAKKGQLDRTIEDYNKAIQLDPNDAKSYTKRGAAYALKGQHDRAIEDLNKAIALDPNVAGAYNNRGLAYAMLKNMGRAISDFQKACDLGDEKGCENLQRALRER